MELAKRYVLSKPAFTPLSDIRQVSSGRVLIQPYKQILIGIPIDEVSCAETGDQGIHFFHDTNFVALVGERNNVPVIKKEGVIKVGMDGICIAPAVHLDQYHIARKNYYLLGQPVYDYIKEHARDVVAGKGKHICKKRTMPSGVRDAAEISLDAAINILLGRIF